MLYESANSKEADKSAHLGSTFVVCCHKHVSHVLRKPVFGVSDLVLHKSGCTTTEDGQRLEIFWIRKKRHCTIYVVKTKALISCVLIIVFAIAKRVSHNLAHMIPLIYIRNLMPPAAAEEIRCLFEDI